MMKLPVVSSQYPVPSLLPVISVSDGFTADAFRCPMKRPQRGFRRGSVRIVAATAAADSQSIDSRAWPVVNSPAVISRPVSTAQMSVVCA
jgi:hypothetical protein